MYVVKKITTEPLWNNPGLFFTRRRKEKRNVFYICVAIKIAVLFDKLAT